MKIKEMKLDELRPDPKNPRTISKSQMGALSRSLDRWGVVEPIVVNKDGTIIGGHQRYESLRKAGVKKVACVVLDLSVSEAHALNLALNRISGEFDDDLLS